ncbi:MAG: ComF family protein [Prevotellaceae bacterium]|jgi:ComF family protein|nr:ComF family protein [Prevotellaceae bacterium]
MKLKTVIKHLVALFYPDMCLACEQLLLSGEQYLCSDCLLRMPRTQLHDIPNNHLEQRFAGKVRFDGVTAFYYYNQESPFQNIIHKLKYRQGKHIGYIMGQYAAAELADSVRFAHFDALVPVPLHPNKLKRRGYNQSAVIAEGLSAFMKIPVDETNLYRKIENPTQTKKTAIERWKNTEGIFAVHHPEAYTDKRLLLIDDVLTTGATITACLQAINAVCNARVSVFTVAAVP